MRGTRKGERDAACVGMDQCVNGCCLTRTAEIINRSITEDSSRISSYHPSGISFTSYFETSQEDLSRNLDDPAKPNPTLSDNILM
ncbi:hypothetical protein V1478_000603 [Vespula squamosa]|uniref:Uncharacterized protein n=1 Tax=Vespula squamosa TaxID=30214 RepID=A0ABD2C600_VESSQ